jgi:hypothetical protein
MQLQPVEFIVVVCSQYDLLLEVRAGVVAGARSVSSVPKVTMNSLAKRTGPKAKNPRAMMGKSPRSLRNAGEAIHCIDTNTA